jgi:ABC-type Fe3+ transport system permease subunit
VAQSHVHHWFGVTDRNGWIYLITGAILVLSAFFMPVFGGTKRRRVRTAAPRAVDDRGYDERV